MADKEINPTERKLSLDEMLKLADEVDSWQYFPAREEWFTYTPEHYIGEINNIMLEVGQAGATPWGGWLRYIRASYGNLKLGYEDRGKDIYDDRLDRLFHYSIPEKIRKQGLAIIEKISREKEKIEIERKQEAIKGENI